MQGIIFGSLHSYRDLALVLSEKEIGAPSVKVHKIDIEGADGSIDMTEYFGRPNYGEVQHRFTFSSIANRDDFLTQYAIIKNALHGRKLRISLDADPGYYYVGRCYVGSFTSEKGVGHVQVECECEPWKYNAQETVVTVAVDGSLPITLTNGRKRAVPQITTTGAMTISYNGGMWTHGAGTFIIPELELVEGENIVTVTGTGSITFKWQEGEL